jgi:hypothetical protein
MLDQGFALLPTPGFCDERLLRRLHKTRLTLPSGSKRWLKYAELARYGGWLQALLDAALPEEAVSLAALEFRYESAGTEDAQVDRLHADGSYLRSVNTLYGPATIYREDGVERPVPPGQTLLMTAQERARAMHVPCTLHRRPGAGPERAVIVCSFEPCQQEPAVGEYLLTGS